METVQFSWGSHSLVMRLTGSDTCGYKTDNSLTTCQHATSLRSTGSEVIEWGGTWSEDDGGVRGCGARLGLHCRGGVRVHMCWDGRGACRSGWNELGWVGIGDSLTSPPLKPLHLEVAEVHVWGGCLQGEGCT